LETASQRDSFLASLNEVDEDFKELIDLHANNKAEIKLLIAFITCVVIRSLCLL